MTIFFFLGWMALTASSFLFDGIHVSAFSPSSWNHKSRIQTSSSSKHEMGGLFGDGGLFGGKKKQANDPNAPQPVFQIPVESLKVGGLRFALGLFLIGEQGTPVKGTWQASQASDNKLEMFYMVDQSAMFEVILEDKAISVNRYGTTSLPYLLQESVILHGLLDELHTLAYTEEIDIENRLVQFKDETVLENAREILPARAAEA